ncbi:hypothetical protein Tco_0594200 [Tanacetum coccineum]
MAWELEKFRAEVAKAEKREQATPINTDSNSRCGLRKLSQRHPVILSGGSFTLPEFVLVASKLLQKTESHGMIKSTNLCCLRKLSQRHPILSDRRQFHSSRIRFSGLETVAEHRIPLRDQFYQYETFGSTVAYEERGTENTTTESNGPYRSMKGKGCVANSTSHSVVEVEK